MDIRELYTRLYQAETDTPDCFLQSEVNNCLTNVGDIVLGFDVLTSPFTLKEKVVLSTLIQVGYEIEDEKIQFITITNKKDLEYYWQENLDKEVDSLIHKNILIEVEGYLCVLK